MLSLFSGVTSVALYLVAALLLLQRLRHAHRQDSVIAPSLASVALVLHAVVLHGQMITDDGLRLGFFHSLSLATWVMVLLMLVVALRQPVQNLGVGVFPLTALILVAALAWGSGGPVMATEQGALGLHILLSLCAYGVLGLAAIQAVVLAYQHHVLHDHHALGAVRGLPPLYTMETLLFRMIGIGFLLLTAALATGLLFLEDLFAQQMVHKTVLTLSAWLLFATLLVGHWLWGWRGLTAVRLTLIAIALLVVGYSGSKLVIEIILQPD